MFSTSSKIQAAQRNLSDILLKSNRNQIIFTIFRLICTVRLLFQIIRKMVNTIWFRFDLMRFLCVWLRIDWNHSLPRAPHYKIISPINHRWPAANLQKNERVKTQIGKINTDQIGREIGVSRHHGGWIEKPPETPRTVTALSYWRVWEGPLISPPLCREALY